MGKVLKFIGSVALTVVGFVIGGPIGGAIAAMGVSSALSIVSAELFGPKIPKTQLSRLNVSLDPSTPRKSVFGTTALNLDLRYHESSGTNQEYIDYIICTSAHKITSIDEIWFDDKQAWTAGGGVTGTYSGYLTVATRTEGTSANTIAINGGAKWGSSCRLTGCSYVHLRIKRTGATSKVESPLVSGLPSRVTIRGNGALLYDPRKDSTVTGGSGSHRANDQSTWGSYTDPDDCDNPALQLLWWLLGWKINSVLSVGCGVPYTRIDMESFITAANICDENVTLAAGGTQKRYRTSATASDADDRMEIINAFLSCMNGTLRDNNGKLTLTVMKNDLANYVLSFDDDDILDSFEWNQTRGLTETYNVARGRYVDPSDNSLYQLVDYPEVRITSLDGIERVVTIDLPYVEEGRRAQRIAKQVLQRNQYRGMFSATFTAKAMGCQVGDVVRLTFGALGWTNKLFRVVSQQIDFTGKVPLALVEENAAIYAWDAEEQAVVTPTAPTVYDPLNNPFILGTNDAATTADWSGVVNDDGKKPEDWATPGDNLIINANLSNGTEGYGHINVPNAATRTAPSTGDPGYYFRSTASIYGADFNYGVRRNFPDGVQQMYFSALIRCQNVAGYQQVFMFCYDDAGVFAGSVSANLTVSAAGTWETAKAIFTKPAKAVSYTLFYYAQLNGGTYCDLTGARFTTTEAGADVTSNVIPRHEPTDTATTFTANYQGTVDTGQLPRNIQFTRYRGSVDVSASSTWTVTSQGGISGGTVTVSNGVVNIPSGVTIPSSTEISIKSTRDGFDIISTISVTRLDASPPNTGSGGTTVNDSTFNSVSGTTLTAISDLMTVKTGSAGQIVFSAPLPIYAPASSPVGTFGAIGQWKYRPVGGSFSNAGTQADEVFGAYVYYDTDFSTYFSDDGYISISATVTGLSANTDYEVQLFAARDSSTPTKTISFGGTASATGS